MKPFYRSILKNAWVITWRYKFLWFFGLFAALTSNGGEYDIIIKNFNTVTNIEARLTSLRAVIRDGTIGLAWNNIKAYFVDNVFSSIVIIFAALLIIVIVIWLITVSQTAIINSTNLHREKKENHFLDGFIVGNRFFLPIFLLNLIAKLIIYGGLLVFGIPLTIGYVNSGNLAWLGVLSVFVFLILIPINLIISFITQYASAYVVLRGKKVWEGFIEGCKLFLKNWLISLELAFILFVINFAISYIIIGQLAFSDLPFTRIGLPIFGAVVFVLGALLATFQYCCWTLLFLDINENKGISKLVRIFHPKEIKK
jgi:hypothetical protein